MWAVVDPFEWVHTVAAATRGVVVGVIDGFRSPLPECDGHHWHPQGRSWVCCQCPRRVRRGHDAPEQVGVCAQPVPHFDELQEWLSELTPPDPRPTARVRELLRKAAG